MIHECASDDCYLVMVLYMDPRDFPGRLVARGWIVGRGFLIMQGLPWVMPPRALDRVQEVLRDQGFVRVQLPPDHDQNILEEWIPAPVLWGRE